MHLLKKYSEPLLFISLAIAFLVIFIYLKRTPALVDEHDGYKQILRFSVFDWQLEKISAMPTYYFVLAMGSKIIQNDTLGAMRALTLCFSFFSVFVFYLIAKILSPQNSFIKTIQFAFLPILHIFFFLVYTEPFSLLFTLLSFYFALKKNYSASGFLGIISTAIRQNNIMWMGFTLLFLYVQEHGFKFNKSLVLAHLKKSWSFILGFVLFAVFVYLNGGIAIGDAKMHPGNLSIGNIVFALFTFTILFLPLALAETRSIVKGFVQDKLFLLFTIVCLGIFWFLFNNNHPYNLIDYDYFVRNNLMHFFLSAPALKIAFFIIAVYAIHILKVVKLERDYLYLFYFFSIVFLLPSWLIDVRYYVIPLSFFLLFKKERSLPVEILTIIGFLIMDAWVIKMARTVTMFL
ncbi:MAG TPA: hypothetical protein PKN75_05870 [Bacteroidia bacterium]|nr:hypothetical protein [Bacteroidia bacterium]HNU33102.1 hypothetical protein [Bacteroidia bacterium]